MTVICVIIISCFLVLWILAEAERRYGKKPEREAFSLMLPFRRIAGWYLHRKQRTALKSAGRSAQGFVSRSVIEDLQKLKREPIDGYTAEAYYIEKLSLVLVIIFVGTLLCTALSWQAQSQGLLSKDGRILRGDYRRGKTPVVLEASADGQILQSIQLEINGRVPDYEKVDGLEAIFWRELCETALGDNLSSQEIRSKLELCTRLEGYPFSVKWSSPNPLLVAEDGTVRVLSEKEGAMTVELSAEVTYETWKWNHIWEITVCPPLLTEEERIKQELEAYLVQKEAKSRGEAYLELPDQWQNTELVWREQLEDYGLLFWGLTLITAGAVFYMKDRDLHTKVQKQQEILKASYPTVSNKLLLYLGAGLTIRSAFERMAQEYLCDRQQGSEEIPAYEEIVRTCRELHTGMPEGAAYEHFGKRCGTQEYIRLGAMLSRNLKKGSGMLLDRLQEESENAVRERFHRSRQLGEEASTRLLMPMMLMLGIVMVVIMVPAFGAM